MHGVIRPQKKIAVTVHDFISSKRAPIGGRHALRIVGRLAGILEDEIDIAASRDQFWHDARRKLGKLRRLSRSDIW